MDRRQLLAIMASNILGTSGSLVTDGVQTQWQFNISHKDAMRDANELLTQIEIEQPVATSVPKDNLHGKLHSEFCRCDFCAYCAKVKLRQEHSSVRESVEERWNRLYGRQGGKTLIQLEEVTKRYNEALNAVGMLKKELEGEKAKSKVLRKTFYLVRALVGYNDHTLERAVALKIEGEVSLAFTRGLEAGLR